MKKTTFIFALSVAASSFFMFAANGAEAEAAIVAIQNQAYIDGYRKKDVIYRDGEGDVYMTHAPACAVRYEGPNCFTQAAASASIHIVSQSSSASTHLERARQEHDATQDGFFLTGQKEEIHQKQKNPYQRPNISIQISASALASSSASTGAGQALRKQGISKPKLTRQSADGHSVSPAGWNPELDDEGTVRGGKTNKKSVGGGMHHAARKEYAPGEYPAEEGADHQSDPEEEKEHGSRGR